MNKGKTDTLILMLLGIVILLMIANLGLFVRMNQLQSRVIQALEPFQRPMGLNVGTRAPLFTLSDTTGQSVSLQDFAGRQVLLAFTATTCPACPQIYPILKDFQELHPDIAVLLISRGSQEDNATIVRKEGLTFPVLNGQDELVREYQVPAFPFFYLLDRQGNIASRGIALSLEQLENLTKTSR
ncbi:MAG: redoxin domain-containing protein [Thermoflexales bacterium]|nr:redoxin domain-containing protein [Thermoflexales bacterium]